MSSSHSTRSVHVETNDALISGQNQSSALFSSGHHDIEDVVDSEKNTTLNVDKEVYKNSTLAKKSGSKNKFTLFNTPTLHLRSAGAVGAVASPIQLPSSQISRNATAMPRPSRAPVPIPTRRPTTARPTRSPVVWKPEWDWLSQYSGADGPIFSITVGRNDFAGVIFIAGEFTDSQCTLQWGVPYGVNNYSWTPISTPGVLTGFVSSTVQIWMPVPDFEKQSEAPSGFPSAMPSAQPTTYAANMKDGEDFTWLILLSCVCSGIILGVGFALGCYNQNASKRDDTGGPDGLGEETALLGGILLKTLAGHDFSADSSYFSTIVHRAMQSRHLPSSEALLIVNPKEVVLSKIIGEGSFGRVWSGMWKSKAVAVKEFVFAQAAMAGGSSLRDSIIDEIVGEACIMACLRHPRILQLHGCTLTMQAIWIVSELCVRGSLRMVLGDQSIQLPLIQKLTLCMDVADGMLYLHSRSPPLIHRDLKSHNIFVAEPSPGHFVAKIGDWGSARAVQLSGTKSMTYGVGTACWLAPEVINYARSSKKSDVFAYGIVLWEVYTRKEVYEGLSAAQIIAKVAHEGLRPRLPSRCPWIPVMTACWMQRPEARPGFEEICANLRDLLTQLQLKAPITHASNGGRLTGYSGSKTRCKNDSLTHPLTH